MKKSELTTLALVAGGLIAAIYFIDKTAPGLEQGESDTGEGIGVGAGALGIGAGSGFIIWALGNFIFPGL